MWMIRFNGHVVVVAAAAEQLQVERDREKAAKGGVSENYYKELLLGHGERSEEAEQSGGWG